jgi:hypothetical protein
MTAIAVNILVIEPMRNCESVAAGLHDRDAEGGGLSRFLAGERAQPGVQAVHERRGNGKRTGVADVGRKRSSGAYNGGGGSGDRRGEKDR